MSFILHPDFITWIVFLIYLQIYNFFMSVQRQDKNIGCLLQFYPPEPIDTETGFFDGCIPDHQRILFSQGIVNFYSVTIIQPSSSKFIGRMNSLALLPYFFSYA